MARLTDISETLILDRLNKPESLCAIADKKMKAAEVSRILAKITKPGLSNILGQTPASFAVLADDPVQLERLISIGYPIFDRDGPLLNGAAYWNSTRVANYLLDHGADPNQASDGGGTPLMVAVSEGGPEVAKLLLPRGAHVDSKTVRYALICKNQEMVDRLMSTGVLVDEKTRSAALRLHMQLPSDGF